MRVHSFTLNQLDKLERGAAALVMSKVLDDKDQGTAASLIEKFRGARSWLERHKEAPLGVGGHRYGEVYLDEREENFLWKLETGVWGP